MRYVNFVVTTKQKATVNIQNIKRKEYKYIIKESHQTAREESKRRRTEKNYKTVREQRTK